jgi:hypothetical protein
MSFCWTDLLPLLFALIVLLPIFMFNAETFVSDYYLLVFPLLFKRSPSLLSPYSLSNDHLLNLYISKRSYKKPSSENASSFTTNVP